MNDAFAASGVAVVERMLDPSTAALLYDVLLLRVWRGESRRDDHVETAHSFWGDCVIDAVLARLAVPVERVVGRRLLPTYGYARIYEKGDRLHPHRDREACQVTTTIHLGSDGGAPPPICLEPDARVAQRPGDAVVFLGDEITHWRDTYHGERFGQIFLNYVYEDGARAGLVFDRRVNAFPPGWMERGRR